MILDLAAPIRSWMPPVTYVGYLDGLPDVLLARYPAGFHHPETYKAWICETAHEFAQVQARLDRPVPRGPRGEIDFLSGPDGALGPGRGARPYERIVLMLYPSPADGWPWLVLVSEPQVRPDLQRSRYSWQALPTEAAALDHLARLRVLGGVDMSRQVVVPPPPS